MAETPLQLTITRHWARTFRAVSGGEDERNWRPGMAAEHLSKMSAAAQADDLENEERVYIEKFGEPIEPVECPICRDKGTPGELHLP